MTDEQIIKVLECCLTPHTDVKCYCCKAKNGDTCSKLNLTMILDLIKRQQAVINNLKNDCSVVEVNLEEAFLKECECEIEKAKGQAVRDFAEVMKENLKNVAKEEITGHEYYLIGLSFIDTLVNELYGNPEEVKCKDCKHLMYSDCYGECSQGYKGIVQPDDSCKYGERKLK